MLKIGNGTGFWGDDARGALELASKVDYLTLDYLAELSLSIMAAQRERDPALGYASDFLETVRKLAEHWKGGARPKVITNAGGLAPKRCAQAVRETLDEAGLGSMRIAVVAGDDQLDTVRADPSNPLYCNMEDGRPLSEVAGRLTHANAYLGAEGIIEALCLGADIVITGRVADPSLTVGAAAFHYEWTAADWNRIASATIAGHLIECGRQVTGGISTHWSTLSRRGRIGFPIVEMDLDGSFCVTKPDGSGGAVNIETVTEQLLYEIGDPDNYLSPDVTASFLSLSLAQVEPNRVRVEGAEGKAPSSTYKVNAGISDGYRSEAMLVIRGAQAADKAQWAGEALLESLDRQPKQSCIECLGANDPLEVVLRMAVADPDREVVERFSRSVAPLVTSGPQGITGYAVGRPKVRPVITYWPCLIDKGAASPTVELL